MTAKTDALSEAVIASGRFLSAKLPGRWGRRVRETAKWAVNYDGARSTGVRGWRFARAARYSQLLVAPFGDGRLLVDTDDEEISRIVYMRGDYERKFMRAAVRQLELLTGFSSSGRTLIDVGANIGTTAIDALLHFGFARAICFEPDSRNARILRMNLVLNDLIEDCVVLEMAVSDRTSLVEVVQQPGNFGDSRIVPSRQATPEKAVRCVPIDSLVDDGTIDVDRVGLLWIDAQGHDPHVLNGASSLTEAGIPAVVEYWPGALDCRTGSELLERIIAEHYTRVVDLRAAATARNDASLPVSDLATLRKRYGKRHTDLLLVR